jgi:CAAX protease family protein
VTRVQLKWIFLGPDGVRAGWRFAAFAGLWYASGYVVFPLLEVVYSFSQTGFTPADILVGWLGGSVSVLLISVLLVRLEGRRESWFGLKPGSGEARLLGAGCFAGFAMVTLLVAACWAGGFVRFGGLAERGADLAKYAALWAGGMLMVGVGEELTFRGYPLASLRRGIGFWPAAVILSLLFGGEHLTKPMETTADILNIVLIGLALCVSVRATGSLMFAMGFHAAFDFLALSFYGSPNTGNHGLPLEHHLLDLQIAGPAWLTGGPQGLEASWLLPPLLLLMTLALRRVGR